MSFVYVFRRRAEDVFITNILTLVMHLPKKPSKRFQDVLNQKNIFNLIKILQKMSSRSLWERAG